MAAEIDKIELKRHIGLVDAVFYIVGSVLGTGIFITPVGVYENAGSVGMSLAVWTFCGFHSIFGALVTTELAIMIPECGGPYAYYKKAFGRLPAFLFLWARLVATQASNAGMALTLGEYVTKSIFKDCDPPQFSNVLIALLFTLLISFVVMRSAWFSVKIMSVASVLKLIPIIAIIGVGFYYLFTGSWENFDKPFEGTKSYSDISIAFYSALFTYSGYDVICYTMEEVKNPAKTLPMAFFIALPLVIIIYGATNVAYFTLLSPEEILGSPAIGIAFAEKSMGDFHLAMPVFIVLSIAGALVCYVFGLNRLYYAGAKDGFLPEFISYLHYRYMTPLPSTLTFTVFMCALTFMSGKIEQLLNYSVITDFVVSICTVCALLHCSVFLHPLLTCYPVNIRNL